jgi:hypothetical protein
MEYDEMLKQNLQLKKSISQKIPKYDFFVKLYVDVMN